MPNLLLLKGQSKYNVLRHFMDELAAGLQANGCQVEIMDFQEESVDATNRRLEELSTNPPDVVIAFNGIVNDEIRKYLDVPYIGYMVDHPIIHHGRYSAWGKKDYAICIDQTHAELIKSYYKNIGNVFFLPHGGSECSHFVPFSERELDVSFSGSYTSSQEYLQMLKDGLQPFEQKIAFILITRMQERNLTLEQALSGFLKENNLPVSDEEFTLLCLQYLWVDYFIRAFYREELLRTLAANGIYVDIYGDKWEAFECENKEYLRLHEPLDFKDSLEVLGNTKISLNSIPSFKAGGHERLFSSMLCGAVCLTDPNAYLEEQFKDGEQILYYNRDRMQTAADQVLYYLEYQEEAEEISNKAHAAALEKHTWAMRAKELLEILKEEMLV